MYNALIFFIAFFCLFSRSEEMLVAISSAQSKKNLKNWCIEYMQLLFGIELYII